MNIEEYLQVVAPKIGPNAALGLTRDARFKALEALLIEKGIATRSEIDAECDKQLGDMAKTISEMPSLPVSEQNGGTPEQTDTN
jgi:hypothetical protein